MDVFEAVLRDHHDFLRAASLSAAFELGLFDVLADMRPSGMTCAQLAQQLNCSGPRLRALLDVLVLENYLLASGGREDAYRLAAQTPPERPMLTLPDSGWGRLAAVIKTDRPLLAVAAEADYLRHLCDIGETAAANLIPLLPAARNFLDMGGGLGAYSAAFLRARPEARATLADRAPIVARARRSLRRFTERVEFIALDLLCASAHAALGQRIYDQVLLANVLHLYGPADAARLVALAAGALAPGGSLIVKDLDIKADRSGPEVGVYFALNMALYTQSGDVYPPELMARWMCDAGLKQVAVVQREPAALVLSGTA